MSHELMPPPAVSPAWFEPTWASLQQHSLPRWFDDAKLRISYRRNYRLWTMTEFKRQPEAHILLGDSRMNHLDVTALNDKTNNQWYNLGYGSADGVFT